MSSMSSSVSAGKVADCVEPRQRAALELLFLAQTLFKPLLATTKRLVDRLGRRREPALQNRQCEADGAGAFVILQRLGAVELLADVIGDGLVELRLGVGELVGNRVRDALGKQRRRRRTSAGSP